MHALTPTYESRFVAFTPVFPTFESGFFLLPPRDRVSFTHHPLTLWVDGQT